MLRTSCLSSGFTMCRTSALQCQLGHSTEEEILGLGAGWNVFRGPVPAMTTVRSTAKHVDQAVRYS